MLIHHNGALTVLLIVIVRMCYSLVVDNQPCIDAMADGCSAPNELKKRNEYIRDTFVPACNKHDVCYECGKELGWTKQDCDASFLKHMQEICYNLYATKRSASIQLIETISTAATQAKKNFSNAASVAADQAKDTFSTAANIAKDTFSNVASQAKDSLLTTANQAKDTLSNVASQAKDSLSTAANQAKDTLSMAASITASQAKDTASQAKDTVSNVASQAKDTLSSAASEAKDTLSNAASIAKDSLSIAANQAKNTFSTAVSQAKDTVSTAATLTSYIATWITKPKNTLEDCMYAAKVFHFVVDKFGDEHFKPSPGHDVKEVCYMPCTANYGNPDF